MARSDSAVAAGAFGRPNAALGASTCDLRHSRVGPRLLSLTTQIRDNSMTRFTYQEYFEQVIRARLRDLAARQASGRELTERLGAIAAAYKLFLFDDNSRS